MLRTNDRAGLIPALHPCVTFDPVCGAQSRLFAIAHAPLTAAPFLARFFCPRQRSQAKPPKVTKSGWGPSQQGRSAPRPCARTSALLYASASTAAYSVGRKQYRAALCPLHIARRGPGKPARLPIAFPRRFWVLLPPKSTDRCRTGKVLPYVASQTPLFPQTRKNHLHYGQNIGMIKDRLYND